MQLALSCQARLFAGYCRCDLTLVCSPVEHQLLQQHYGAPAHKLCSAPLFVHPAQCAAPGGAQRPHFMAIGNFRSAACCVGVVPLYCAHMVARKA